VLRTTLTNRMSPLNAETLRAAPRQPERSTSVGRLVLDVS
jgi:hypothetical protein